MQRLCIKDTSLDSRTLAAIFGMQSRIIIHEDFIVVELDGRYEPQTFCYATTSVLLSDQHNYLSPVQYRTSAEVEELFGIDFAGAEEPQILPGSYYPQLLSYGPVFMPAVTAREIMDSQFVAVRVPWYGGKYGRNPGAAKLMGAANACSVASNNGRRGVDFWILPWSVAKCGPDRIRAFKRQLANQCQVVSGGGSLNRQNTK